MLRSRRALLLLAVAVTLTWVGTPRDAEAAEPSVITVATVDASRYPTVSATITLPPALADAGLTDEHFSVEENQERRAVRATRLPGDALEVVLVIDTSGSMRGRPIAAARTAASTFLTRLPDATRVGVVGFGTTPALASELTADRAAVAAAITNLSVAGETALYDAIGLALDQFPATAGVRRHLVLVSDGGDTASGTTLDALLARLAGTDVRLDAAEMNTDESNVDALNSLVQAGRGRLVSAADAAALNGVYDELGRGLANQYRLEFQAGGHGATPLRIVAAQGDQQAEATTTVELPPPPPAPAASPPPAPSDPPAVEAVNSPNPTLGGWGLAAGGALTFAALLIVVWMLLAPGTRPKLVPTSAGPASATAVTSLTQRAAAAADEALERHGNRGRVNAALERAGIALRAGEFVVLAASLATVALALGLMLKGALLGLVLAAVTALATWVVVSVQASRRRRAFQEQLGDNLQLLAGSLRTGYAVLQAIDVVAREGESPSSDEFRRIVVETRLGRDLVTSLHAMADRVGGDDLQWVVQAIEINREIGGDLAEVLDNVASTIRERDRVRRQVSALSAEGRLSAYVLVALPLLLGGALAVINPRYFSELTRGTGLMLCFVGAGMLAIGSFWMSRMVKVEF